MQVITCIKGEMTIVMSRTKSEWYCRDLSGKIEKA